MRTKTTSTEESLFDEHIKTLVYTKNRKLYISNVIDPNFIPFFKALFPNHKEIVFFEHIVPSCPSCGEKMKPNGSKKSKPNKHEGIRKEQYKCPKCNKSKITSNEDYIPKNSNYSYDIAEKGLNYDTITYASYESKSEIIYLENDVKIPRQTVYYLESIHTDEFLRRQEEINLKLLEKQGILPSGYYHYDEQFPHENGEQKVRLALVDSITHLVINDVIFDKEDFGKELVEAFLDSSLQGLPKEAIITDGDRMYPEILEKIGVKHQICIFHVIKNHHDKSFKSIRFLKRRINTINNQILTNKTTIEMLTNQIQNENLTKKKKEKKRSKIKKLDKKNRALRKERKEKNKQLKEYLSTNERIQNIYGADDKKGSKRRFNTINNQRKYLDRDTDKFLGNLEKRYGRTTTFYDDPLIPRTNNNIERYFGITLPRYMKRKFRTTKGLTRWLQLQKIRWTRRNVLHIKDMKNISMTEYLQEQKCATSCQF